MNSPTSTHTHAHTHTHTHAHTELIQNSTKNTFMLLFLQSRAMDIQTGLTTEICSHSSADFSSCTSGQIQTSGGVNQSQNGIPRLPLDMLNVDIGRIQQEGNQLGGKYAREGRKKSKGVKRMNQRKQGKIQEEKRPLVPSAGQTEQSAHLQGVKTKSKEDKTCTI